MSIYIVRLRNTSNALSPRAVNSYGEREMCILLLSLWHVYTHMPLLASHITRVVRILRKKKFCECNLQMLRTTSANSVHFCTLIFPVQNYQWHCMPVYLRSFTKLVVLYCVWCFYIEHSAVNFQPLVQQPCLWWGQGHGQCPPGLPLREDTRSSVCLSLTPAHVLFFQATVTYDKGSATFSS